MLYYFWSFGIGLGIDILVSITEVVMDIKCPNCGSNLVNTTSRITTMGTGTCLQDFECTRCHMRFKAEFQLIFKRYFKVGDLLFEKTPYPYCG